MGLQSARREERHGLEGVRQEHEEGEALSRGGLLRAWVFFLAAHRRAMLGAFAPFFFTACDCKVLVQIFVSRLWFFHARCRRPVSESAWARLALVQPISGTLKDELAQCCASWKYTES